MMFRRFLSVFKTQRSQSNGLFHWRPPHGTGNFGDELSPVIVGRMARRTGHDLNQLTRSRKRLLALGSIMHFAKTGDTIWGSGVNGSIGLDNIKASALDIRAVRGPITAAILRERGFNVPNVFGDPALLLPDLLGDHVKPQPVHNDLVIVHMSELSIPLKATRSISPLAPWEDCLDAILSSHFVISSSLHGIIVAEAFGIGARQLRLSNHEAQLKYDDYAQGTGRAALVPARSIEEAMAMGPQEPIAFDGEPLRNAFPLDLWTCSHTT